ncbi:MAG: peroxiredoxin [Polyangiaceae bacterium]
MTQRFLLLFALALVACESKPTSPATGAPSASAAPSAGGLLAVGSPAPAIEGTAHNGERVSLKELAGKSVVVYFYPKDDTPGCTVEAQGLRDEWSALQAAGATVIGVSTDDTASHKAFAEKYSLPFLLLPDPDGAVARAFGVPLTLGHAKRVTFVIGKDGKIAKVFPDVNPKGHAQEVLAAVR